MLKILSPFTGIPVWLISLLIQEIHTMKPGLSIQAFIHNRGIFNLALDLVTDKSMVQR